MKILANKHTKTGYLSFVNNLQNAYESYDSYAVFFFANHKTLNIGGNSYVYLSNVFDLKPIQSEREDYLYDKLIEILSHMPENSFSQKDAVFEAASIFRSFGIKNILVQFTGDDSILFEFIQVGIYFLLEVFNDGDIVYLRRNGRDKPSARDICQEDLYVTIQSIYEATVESNVL